MGVYAGTSASALEVSGYTETKYPIVLVHGLFGFDTLAGVDYFYGVPESLTKDGASVYVAQVSATNSSEVRGEQLLAQVETLLAATGANKVNLVGHSHGGPTARYVASVRPDLVASVTSIGGVHKGSKVADLVRGTVPEGSVTEGIAVKLASGLTTLINLLSGGSDLEQDGLASLEALTTEGSRSYGRTMLQIPDQKHLAHFERATSGLYCPPGATRLNESGTVGLVVPPQPSAERVVRMKARVALSSTVELARTCCAS